MNRFLQIASTGLLIVVAACGSPNYTAGKLPSSLTGPFAATFTQGQAGFMVKVSIGNEPKARLTALASRHGCLLADGPTANLARLGWHRLVLPLASTGISAGDAMLRLRADNEISAAEADMSRHLLFPTETPAPRVALAGDPPAPAFNDSYLKYQYSVPLIDLATALARTQGSSRTTLAVIDAGVDGSHPDLAVNSTSRVVAGLDAIAQVAGDAAHDRNGHGTHVAGIAAASANNGIGVVGVAPRVSILAEKVLSDQGSGTWAEVAAGIVDAVDRGARVLNLSLGDQESARVLEDALRYAFDHDVLVVAAMGNDGKDIKQYPAAFPGVMAVGATTRADLRTGFSNYGPWISVTAPGHLVYSTFPVEVKPYSYAFLSGTSMASPHVAGLAALLRDLHPEWKAQQVRQHIERTAHDLGPNGFDQEYGHGRIDAGRALSQAL